MLADQQAINELDGRVNFLCLDRIEPFMDQNDLIEADRKSTRLNSSHQLLPSSPPRRSPDRDAARPAGNQRAGRPGEFSVPRSNRAVHGPERFDRGRSEEHTSELQSPTSPLFPSTTLSRSGCGPTSRQSTSWTAG